MKTRAVVALLLMILAAAPADTAERLRLIVVVSDSNGVTDLSIGDLRRVYLGEMTRWPDGHRIVPVMLPPRSPESDVFLKRVVRMSAIDFAQAWIGVVFRGVAAAPPVVVATSADALRFVATHTEAIAVIRQELSSTGVPPTSTGVVNATRFDAHIAVHVINIDGRAPGVPHYGLAW